MIDSYRIRPIEILLIEDNHVDIRMTQEAFREYHISNHLSVVTDGEAAMDFIYQRGEHENAPRPDLILLDLNLPRKDGKEILNEVKADRNLRSIPIVVLTTSELDKDIQRSYCGNANAFLTKPIEFDDFVRMMKTIGDFWLTYGKLPSSGEGC